MKSLGALLIAAGVLLMGSGAWNAPKARTPSHLAIAILPGLFLTIIGLKLRQSGAKILAEQRARADVGSADAAIKAMGKRFANRAGLGISFGLPVMFLSGEFAREWPHRMPAAAAAMAVGLALVTIGCVNLARAKGRSGWLGLLAYLLLPGLVILACFPNRRKRLLEERGRDYVSHAQSLMWEDRDSGRRFLLALVPLAALLVWFESLLLTSRPRIDAANWKPVDGVESGFRLPTP